ncbi:hypothetical protein [Winogradskyella poriferorum]|uniref:DUF1257 domain-containing protein n=1 Tax=Winogradskyella poriferorum TaxID=307627 RepID=A0ABU7W649_9FLAO
MNKEEIIKRVNDIIDKRGFSTSIQQSEKLTSASYSLNTNYKLEISNYEIFDDNKYSFKVNSIQDVGEIWLELTKNNDVDIERIMKDAVQKSNIDLDKELFLILNIQ